MDGNCGPSGRRSGPSKRVDLCELQHLPYRGEAVGAGAPGGSAHGPLRRTKPVKTMQNPNKRSAAWAAAGVGLVALLLSTKASQAIPASVQPPASLLASDTPHNLLVT